MSIIILIIIIVIIINIDVCNTAVYYCVDKYINIFYSIHYY